MDYNLTTVKGMIDYYETKAHPITRKMVWDAYQKIRKNGKAAGVDGVSFGDYEANLQENLYKLWNRLSSGSYFPQITREKSIPKSGGGTRSLGIATVEDRTAQQVVRAYLEPLMEPTFHDSSYGYRPKRHAHQAIAAATTNCFTNHWVLDIDIKGYFDAIDHSLLMKAIERYTAEKWVLMYIERWLKAGTLKEDGTIVDRISGTAQGSVLTSRTHPQTLSSLGGLKLEEEDFSFGYFIKSIIFMINEEVTEFGISRKNQPGTQPIGATKAAWEYCGTVNGHLWRIPNTSLSVCSASQGAQTEARYSREFSGFYSKTSTQSDPSGKRVRPIARDIDQQNSQNGLGRVFVEKTASWPKRRRSLKYRSPMIVCGSKSSHKRIIFSSLASQSSFRPQILFTHP